MSYNFADQLDVTERDWVWQSNDPIFPALYCWHEGQWWYATKSGPYWRESTASAGVVTNDGHGFTARTRMTSALFDYGDVANSATSTT